MNGNSSPSAGLTLKHLMVRFIGAIVAMDVRIVSYAVPMMNQANDALGLLKLGCYRYVTSLSDSLIPTRQIDQAFCCGKFRPSARCGSTGRSEEN